MRGMENDQLVQFVLRKMLSRKRALVTEVSQCSFTDQTTLEIARGLLKGATASARLSAGQRTEDQEHSR
jgi:hypothetical protein